MFQSVGADHDVTLSPHSHLSSLYIVFEIHEFALQKFPFRKQFTDIDIVALERTHFLIILSRTAQSPPRKRNHISSIYK